MSKPLQACLAHLGVLTLGLAAWHFAGKRLQGDGLFEAEPNVLSLKGSPFGKTIAMAMQGPIDVYWHEGEAHDHVHAAGESCTECDGGHGEEGTAQKAGLEDLEGGRPWPSPPEAKGTRPVPMRVVIMLITKRWPKLATVMRPEGVARDARWKKLMRRWRA